MKSVLSAICASALVVTAVSAAEPILAPGYLAPTPAALNLKTVTPRTSDYYYPVQAPAAETAPPAPGLPPAPTVPPAPVAPPKVYAAPPIVHSAPAMPLYRNVKVKDPHHAHPCAVPTVIPVPDPCGGPGCVYIQICAPPCGPVDVRHRLLKTVIDYGDGYEVELRARRNGLIIVDYDD
ncbi:MAG: hypothetical protein ACF8PG_07375 [Maioricimonas sp. JB045]|uniref:hypothetical protein n=1 Tax=Maioricimonas sp. JC845 TaxID=3232138 RepID=UPI003458C12C